MSAVPPSAPEKPASPAGTDDTAIEQGIIDAAIAWYAHLASGHAQPSDWRTCAEWREADPRHECAWQRLEAIAGRLRQASGDPHLPTREVVTNSADYLASRRRALKTLAALVVGAPGFWWAARRGPLPDYFADHRTLAGEQKTVNVTADVELLLNSATTVDIESHGDGRRIMLRSGEIRIDSTAGHGRAGAFEVLTGHGRIRPVGTRFTVRRYAQEPVTTVAVLDGAVELLPTAGGTRSARIEAGEQGTFHHAGIEARRPLERATTAWTRGLLLAQRRRLGDVLTELARHRSGWLTWDETIADLRLTGSFPLAQPDRVLAAIERTLPVRVRYFTRLWAVVEPA